MNKIFNITIGVTGLVLIAVFSSWMLAVGIFLFAWANNMTHD